MKRTDDLSEAMQSYISDNLPASADHPSEDRWQAYISQTLDEKAQKESQDHLIICADCRKTLQRLRFQDPTTNDPEVTEFESKTFQRLIQAKLAQRDSADRQHKKTLPIALAAILLLTPFGAAGGWLLRGRELTDILQPKLSSQIAILDTATYRGGPEGIRMRADAQILTLEIEWPTGLSFSQYQVTLLGGDGTELWTSGPQDEPPANLVLLRRWLKQAKVNVVLHGGERGESREIGRFPIHIS